MRLLVWSPLDRDHNVGHNMRLLVCSPLNRDWLQYHFGIQNMSVNCVNYEVVGLVTLGQRLAEAAPPSYSTCLRTLLHPYYSYQEAIFVFSHPGCC